MSCKLCDGYVRDFDPTCTYDMIDGVRVMLNPGIDQFDGSENGDPCIYVYCDQVLFSHRIEEECSYPINFCPMCGERLRKEEK